VSIVEVKCPRCGSPCAQSGGKPNEYVCSHCDTVFHFIDTSQRTVTTDVRVRNCVFCGKSLDKGKGFRCTRCGREYFCDSCVDLINYKYVCVDCMTEAGETCQSCNKYAVYTCIQCGKKACKKHYKEVGFTSVHAYGRGLVYYCSRCRGFVCIDCFKHRFFSSANFCPRCNTQLTAYSPYV
jgi:hypothetical protein